MKRAFLLVAIIASVQPFRLAAQATTPGSESSKEIDADVWNAVIATVAAGDLEGMAATYHPDAVLVNSTTSASIK